MLLVLAGCSVSVNPRDNFDRPEQIRIGVEGVVPPGTDSEEAVQRMAGLGYDCEAAPGGRVLDCPGNEGWTSTAPDSAGDCGILASPHLVCSQSHVPKGWFDGAQRVEVYVAVDEGRVGEALVMAWYESAFVL